MKKILFVSMILIAVLALSACSSAAALPGAAVGKVIQSAMNGLEAATATPESAQQLSGLQIAVGILKLADTDLAISADQAAELLPLWQDIQEKQKEMPQGGMPSDSQGAAQGTPQAKPQGTPQSKPQMSGTPTAPEEREDEFQAIRDVLSQEQLQAITDMELDADTMTAYLEEQGIELPEMPQMQGGDGTQANMTPPADGQRPTLDANITLTPRPTLSNAEKPANGGPRPGGQQGGGTAPEMSGTPGAGPQMGMGGGPGGPGGGFVPSAVVDALVEYLEGISA